MRKPTIWVPTKSDTNQPVESQMMARLEILELESRGIVLSLVAKTKAMISFAVTAKLICAFVFAYSSIQIVGPMRRLIYIRKLMLHEQSRTTKSIASSKLYESKAIKHPVGLLLFCQCSAKRTPGLYGKTFCEAVGCKQI